jgi:predicted transcriptional regulator
MSHSIELDGVTASRLEGAGETRHQTPAAIARLAIEAYLDPSETGRRELAEDTARWERYLATGEAISDEDVARWLEATGSEQA